MCIPIAAHDQDNHCVLIFNVERVSNNPTRGSEYCQLWVTVPKGDNVWHLERKGSKSNEPVPKKYGLTDLRIFRGDDPAVVTFYNNCAFIRLTIHRDKEGLLSIDVKKGKYVTTYIQNKQILGPRHGQEFADFNAVERVR